MQFYDLFIIGLRKRITKLAKNPWKNKNKYYKRTKYKKVFIIYQILDCSINWRYSLLSIANSSSNPMNASNTSFGATNTSLLINWNCFLLDFLNTSPENISLVNLTCDHTPQKFLYFYFDKINRFWWVIRN